MTHAEKLKHIEEFNELAQNGDWSEAIGMIIADFDVSLFNIPSRKKFIQYCNSAISEDTNITPSQMSNIVKSIKMLKILTEKLVNNSLDSSNKHDDKATYDYALVNMEPHIRIGYGITDMFASHQDFSNALDFCGDDFYYNKLVELFFKKLDISNEVHNTRKNWYLIHILNSAGRYRRKINLSNSKEFLDYGLNSISVPYNIDGLLCLDKSLCADVAKMVVNSKNKETSSMFFTSCCNNNRLEYLVPMLDSGYKSITTGISIAIDRHHYGLATLMLKYKPRKFSDSMVQWLCDRYENTASRYRNSIRRLAKEDDSGINNSTLSSTIDTARECAKISVDICNCIQYALDKAPSKECINRIRASVLSQIGLLKDTICIDRGSNKTVSNMLNDLGIPPLRVFDNDVNDNIIQIDCF